MSLRNFKAAHGGFTLVETMVALLVISIGLLGIAKMQALALASTGTARMRSIAALEASSIAAMMHVNRAYWAAATFVSPATVTMSVSASGTGSFTSTDTNVKVPTGSSCTSTTTCCPSSTPCSAAQLAAVDLQYWALALSQQMPPLTTATISCAGSVTTTAPGTPVSCTVRLDWTENLVELNTGMNTALSTTTNVNALQNNTANGAATHFILYVDP